MTDYIILFLLVLVVVCLFGLVFMNKADKQDKCELYCQINVPRNAPSSEWVYCMEQCMSRQE